MFASCKFRLLLTSGCYLEGVPVCRLMPVCYFQINIFEGMFGTVFMEHCGNPVEVTLTLWFSVQREEFKSISGVLRKLYVHFYPLPGFWLRHYILIAYSIEWSQLSCGQLRICPWLLELVQPLCYEKLHWKGGILQLFFTFPERCPSENARHLVVIQEPSMLL